KHLVEVPNGAIIAIPNDPTNQVRAIMIIEDAGLIKLHKGVTWKATPDNIVSNPKHLKSIALQAAQIPNNLEVVALGII
ncbi:MetQ/NlpA family ABC transporter substrate-binding protein, partial [Francisella tularensis]|uniref:MetQ/NlpA family ABC transporter substrate-binding protein n=1 Tax=Francisella tularensis TaxID=263 RepID=UPI002381A596